MEFLPESEAIRLQWDYRQNLWYVWNVFTSEKHALPRTDVDIPPRLLFDEEGHGYLNVGADACQWVANLFRHVVCKDSETGTFMVITKNDDGDEDLALYTTFMQQSTDMTIHATAQGDRGPSFDVFRFAHAHAGSHYWWSLPSVYKIVFDDGAPQKWYHRYWTEWMQLAEKGGAPVPHCRRAVAVSSSKADPEDAERPSFPERVLHVFTASTFVLLMLVFRWCTASRNRKHCVANDRNSQRWRAMLAGIVNATGAPHNSSSQLPHGRGLHTTAAIAHPSGLGHHDRCAWCGPRSPSACKLSNTNTTPFWFVVSGGLPG